MWWAAFKLCVDKFWTILYRIIRSLLKSGTCLVVFTIFSSFKIERVFKFLEKKFFFGKINFVMSFKKILPKECQKPTH